MSYYILIVKAYLKEESTTEVIWGRDGDEMLYFYADFAIF